MIVPLILACWMLVLFLTVVICRAARGGDRQEDLAALEEMCPPVAMGQEAVDPGRERATSAPLPHGQPALQPS